MFSIELYTLLLRACSEVELNCKQIMKANGAIKPKNKEFNMTDYVKLEKSSKLSLYTATFKNWRKRITCKKVDFVDKVFCPFKNFSDTGHRALDWYQAYNNVKHNREFNMEDANLENCMNAVAAILILLYSQFGSRCIETYGMSGDCGEFGPEIYDDPFDADVIFELTAPRIEDWPEGDQYDFNWSELKNTKNPFDKFDFNSI